VSATLGYGRTPAPPGGAYDLVVQTTSANAYPGFLRGWINGARQPDGSAEYVDPSGEIFVAWPDGRQVVVNPIGADVATARRIARSVKTVDAAEAASTAEALDTRLRALPLLQSTEIGSQRVELRGDGAPAALCLQSSGDDHCVSSSIALGSLQSSSILAGSFRDGARWTVAMAASSPPYLYSQDQLRGRPGSPLTPLPSQTALLGSLHVTLVVVPDGYDTVNLTTDTGSSLSFPVSLTRPSRSLRRPR
jgi:hypothetical protein